jgi:hypothetical protein
LRELILHTDTVGFAPPLYFKTASSTRLTLTYAGYLGIGTSSPNYGTWNNAVSLNTGSGNAAYELAIGGTWQAYFGADATNVYVAAYANKPMLFRTK